MPTKFRVTATFEYEVDDDDVLAWYGTTDPAEMATIDHNNYVNDPAALCAELADHDYTVTVEPVR